MIGYQAFAELCQSNDSNERGDAAHIAALAYLQHSGSAEEHAALYAALVGFLDDSSVKVRAALAHGLLHSAEAPRPIIMALVGDSPIISRAVLQYSPVLVDADLVPLIKAGDLSDLMAISLRRELSPRLAGLLLDKQVAEVALFLLQRKDVSCPARALEAVAAQFGDDPEIRGALFARRDLPAYTRLGLIRKVTGLLRESRIIKGALSVGRLDKLMRDTTDAAVSAIGESSDVSEAYVETLVVSDSLNTRTLLHALVNGRVVFFSECIGNLANVKPAKVFTILEAGSSSALSALFSRAGVAPSLANLLIRFIQHARTADLSDDVSARHYVVTALTEEMLIEFCNDIPAELEEAFTYLNEQNIALARLAARGVVDAFAEHRQGVFALAEQEEEEPLVLPAA